jgi:hypothetical protein
MIGVWFVPGMFGSTIEQVLRTYLSDYSNSNSTILPDGSLHSLDKMAHLALTKDLNSFVDNHHQYPDSIVTVMYPFIDQHRNELQHTLAPILNSKNILVYSDSLCASELNLLFQYYKIANGSAWKKGRSVFAGNNKLDAQQWNSAYQSFNDLNDWEWREWFSLFYPGYTSEWQDQNVPNDWLVLSNTELLFEPVASWHRIFEYLDKTPLLGLNDFAKIWQDKQNYIIEEFNLIDQIVKNTIDNKEFNWICISPVAEAIVQNRLRSAGWEIKCQDLNIFPTTTKHLHNIIERVII